MVSHWSSILLGICMILVLCGCSSNPTDPTLNIDNPVSSHNLVNNQTHGLLGYYELSVDTETGAGEVISIRNPDLHLNITGILNATMGVAVAGVPDQADPPNGLFVFDITLTHPFATKPNLSGFDVTGILITPGTVEIGPLTFAGIDETRLLNADGFTRWWNPSEFTVPGFFGYTQGLFAPTSSTELTATVNPYKYFADILGAEDAMTPVQTTPIDANGGRGIFSAGSANTRRYEIQFPTNPAPVVKFGYAIDAVWAAPTVNPPQELPDDFPMDANRPEAFRVVMAEKFNSLFHDTESGAGGGSLELQVNVHDWQGWSDGTVADEIAGVRIYSPTMFTGGVDAVFLNEEEGKARFTVDLTGVVAPTYVGDHIVYCKAISSEGNYSQTGAPAPDAAVSAWQELIVTVAEIDCPELSMQVFDLEFNTPVSGVICTDGNYADYYQVEIFPGWEATGEAILQASGDETYLALKDGMGSEIVKEPVADGLAVISFDDYVLPTSNLIFEVEITNPGGITNYVLGLDGSAVNVTPDPPLEVTGDSIYNVPWDIYLDGTICYGLGWNGVWTYDVTDPANPVVVGETLHDWPNNLYQTDMSAPYAVYTTHVGLFDDGDTVGVIDFTDPANPFIHDPFLDLPEQILSVTIDSQYIYVGTFDGVDELVTIYYYLSNPAMPTEVGSFDPFGEPDGMILVYPDTDTPYLVLDNLDFVFSMWDVSDPSDVTLAGGSTGYSFVELHDWVSVGDYLLISVDETGDNDNRVSVMELDGMLFDEVGTVNISGYGLAIDESWPYIYLAGRGEGITVINATDPTDPLFVTSVEGTANVYDLAVDDDLIAVRHYNYGTEFYDITSPELPVASGHPEAVNHPSTGIIIDDNYYVANSTSPDDELVTFDPNSPGIPQITYRSDLDADVEKMAIGNGLLATVNWNSWSLYDFADPLNPIHYHTEEIGFATPHGIYIGDGFMYVLYYASFHVIDISAPWAPYKVTEISMPFGDGGRDMFVQGEYVYVITTGGLFSWDITDPLAPEDYGQFDAISDVEGGAIRGNYAYISCSETLQIVSLINPLEPASVGTIYHGVLDLEYVEVHGQFAYLCGFDGELLTCRIYPPNTPSYIGSIETYNPTLGLAAYDKSLFHLSSTAGVRVFELP